DRATAASSRRIRSRPRTLSESSSRSSGFYPRALGERRGAGQENGEAGRGRLRGVALLARVGARLGAIVALAWSSTALALPLEQMSTQVGGRVAHLSVRDVHGEEESSGTGFLISSDGRMAT